MTRSVMFMIANLFAAILVGCGTIGTPQSSVVDSAQLAQCEADRYQYLIGEKADVLERTLIMRYLRIIPFGAPVTKDYRLDRLNIWLTVDGYVERVDCG